MMNFDRREDATTPLDWVSSTEDLDELKIDIFPDQTPGEELEENKQEVVPESDAEDSGSRKGRLGKRHCARAQRRKKKPAGLPKRPLSAYNLFFQEERLKIQRECPSKVGFNDFGKIIGSRWKELSDDDRQKYNALANEDTIRYQREMNLLKLSNKRKKEGTQQQGKNNDKDNPASWATSLLEEANPVQSKDSAQNESRASDDQELQQGQQDPQRSPWGQPVNFLNSCRQYLPFGVHFGMQPGFPVPPGMEINIADANGRERKYMVRYTFYSMRRNEAESFIASFHNGERPPENQFQGPYPGPWHDIMTRHHPNAYPHYPGGPRHDSQRLW
ncbi:hypothetical protein FisN_1Lh104 [Fistulifera solaris]|uniref:HMG box domain-containing protein n=1 Tax=Fistulifera solaris TaxID=1519565 RepID=A0A1Z5K4Y8_FISSO|nr:hypothetical protein FisN_1Lh104 [Fistulifera solaris]|eukprot:GAX21276.1 hypothetical protein FisN_1Lh104 [Fistulifera solaris]